MNPIALIGGFAPLVLFALLDQRIPVASAAALGAAAALVIVMVISRHAIATVPLVQALALAAIAVIAFVGDAQTKHFLAVYGRGLASLTLAAFMLLTAPFAPFTAPMARGGVPRELWHSPRFLETNRKISTAWGFAVLVMGLANLAVAVIGSQQPHAQMNLLRWAPTVIVVLFAFRYTRRVVAEAQAGRGAAPQPRSRF
ncbi:hypothetical protein [Nocardia alni]|uniref:hypothetical protein n=1 Tax=Nocardia alni TaxID=2815723 RepID=UPI001C21A0A4|nr:hypothetical protein [Nocardia alni]